MVRAFYENKSEVDNVLFLSSARTSIEISDVKQFKYCDAEIGSSQNLQ